MTRCRELHYQSQIVEQWVQHPGMQQGHRRDLFGFIDIVAVTGRRIIGIQATTGDNGSKRVDKIMDECSVQARKWLLSGGEIEVWAWRRLADKHPSPGCFTPTGRQKISHWQPRITAIDLSAFETETLDEQLEDIYGKLPY
jgi:hypothetical protein